ncbi:MAG: hypothetical protein LBW85_05395 [Deltaproteobacteria bacterium]|jgi:hypothetical protein|nr:hypothetical protein [Deltaproteobacteria bacterium]
MPREALTKNGLLGLVAARLPDIPPQVTRLAGELILKAIPEGLAAGRPVTLRGFGRLIPRRYGGGSNKKLGLLFRPSPRLAALVAGLPDFPKDVSPDSGPGKSPPSAAASVPGAASVPDPAGAAPEFSGREPAPASVNPPVKPGDKESSAWEASPKASRARRTGA